MCAMFVLTSPKLTNLGNSFHACFALNTSQKYVRSLWKVFMQIVQRDQQLYYTLISVTAIREAPRHSKNTHSFHSKRIDCFRGKFFWEVTPHFPVFLCNAAMLFWVWSYFTYSVLPRRFPIFTQRLTSSWDCFHKIQNAELPHDAFCFRRT